MSNIISRQFTEKDRCELNDLYNLVAGRSRTVEQFDWEWLDNPEGWGSMWLLEDTTNGKIIGHHGLIPIKFNYYGESIMVGKTENTVMHPDYRGKGIYYPFEAKFVQEAEGRFQLLYTTAGRLEQGRIRLKVGYSIVGDYANYIKVTKRQCLDSIVGRSINERVRNKFLATLLSGVSKLASLILMPAFSRRGPVDKTIRLEKVTNIDAVAEKLDGLWKRNKKNFGITADRNSRYLKWRIFDNPNLPHEFLLATRQGEIVGYVVTNKQKDMGAESARIVDIIANNNDEITFDSILNVLVNTFKTCDIHVIHFPTLLSNNFLNKSLKRNGFVSISKVWKILRGFIGQKQQESVLMAKALNDKLDTSYVSDPASWYYTNILGEGVD